MRSESKSISAPMADAKSAEVSPCTTRYITGDLEAWVAAKTLFADQQQTVY